MSISAIALLLLTIINISSSIPSVTIKGSVQNIETLVVKLPVKPLDGISVFVNGSPTPFEVINDTIYVPIFGGGNIVISYDALTREENGLYRLIINSKLNVTLIIDLNRVLPNDLPITGSYDYRDSLLTIRLPPGKYLVSYSTIIPLRPTPSPSPAKPIRPSLKGGGLPIGYIAVFIAIIAVIAGVVAAFARRKKA